MIDQTHKLDVLRELGVPLWLPKQQAAVLLAKTEQVHQPAEPIAQDGDPTQSDLTKSDLVKSNLVKSENVANIAPSEAAQVEAEQSEAAQAKAVLVNALPASEPVEKQPPSVVVAPVTVPVAITPTVAPTDAPAHKSEYKPAPENTKALPPARPNQQKPNQQESSQQKANLTQQNTKSTTKVYGFDWYAFAYRNWILLVDDAAVNHEKLGLLWQNIQRGLGADLKHLHFPLLTNDALLWAQRADGAETLSHTSLTNAKASIAGWLFAIKQTMLAAQGNKQRSGQNAGQIVSNATALNEDSICIGLLTDVADELTTSAMQRLPTLREMLEEPLLKRQLWRTING